MPDRFTLCSPAFTYIVKLLIASRVGRSFTPFTVKRKSRVVLFVPSLALMLIVELPYAFGKGVIVRLRFVPLPLRDRFALGTRFVFDELVDNIKAEATVSASLTVKAMLVEVSSLITWA